MLLPSFLGFFFSSQIFPQLQDWHFITWLPKSEIAGITRKDFAWKGGERKLFMITSLLLKKKIDKIGRIVPKKTHYLYFDARRHSTATIFKWANRKNQTGKLSLSLLKRLYASPSFRLRPCTLPYKANVSLHHAVNGIRKHGFSPVSLLHSFFLLRWSLLQPIIWNQHEIICTPSKCTYSLKLMIVYYWSYF